MTAPSRSLADGLAGLIRHLEASEMLDAAEIRSLQLRRLGRVAAYCCGQSPAFAARLANAGLAPRDLEHAAGFESLPLLTRRAIQSAGESLFCREVPSTHTPIQETHSSGSTGEPVIVRRTALTEFVRMALTMRDHAWHGRDLRARLCTVRGNVSSYTPYPDWGLPTTLLGATGPMLSLPLVTDTTTLAAWIKEFDPAYLLLLPTTLRALAAYYRRQNWRLPSLREIRTFGETVNPATRDEVATTFGVPIVDCYSSSEVGYIALMCPISGLYHVMSESIIAEVLDDQGNACAPGQIGRVVLTDLHNFATPVVRYDVGDYAEVGEPCRCGRGLPTWKRILGRQRNMVVKPDGSRHWPVTGFYRCREVAPIVQYQVIQHDKDSFEARLVVERDLTPTEEDTLRRHFAACMGSGLSLRFTYVADRQPVGAGKFEEFICRVPGHENLEAGPSHASMRT